MAAKRLKKPPPPSKLAMSLLAPGMTLLHRAGLGGLACTLKYIERAYRAGVLQDDEVSGGPWPDGAPPWTIDTQSVTLDFTTPEGAGEYLKRLFTIAFDIKDGLIYLPGQYEQEPSLAVRAELQSGLTLTFLQHGRVRQLAKSPTVFQHDPVGDGLSLVTVEYKRCAWFKHQAGWKEFVDNGGRIHGRPVEVIGPLSPGAVVRHVSFTADTKIVDTADRILPLYFAIVGCLALPVNRGVGVLIAPEVDDLEAFVWDRPAMTPLSPRECRIASPGDAALQAQIRARSRGILDMSTVPGTYAMELRATSWASQQKSRVSTVATRAVSRFEGDHASDDDRRLDLFEVALAELPPRVRPGKAHAVAKGEPDVQPAGSPKDSFWTDSVVRPHIANNLAQGRRWYEDFTHLMRDRDDSGRSLQERVSYEKKGLQEMVSKTDFTPTDELALVNALHRAIYMRRGQILRDTMGEEVMKQRQPPTPAVFKRWQRFMEQLRLALVGAKTQAQVRRAINLILARAGQVPELKDHQRMPDVQRLIFGDDWERVRDLALFALASYKRPEGAEPLPAETDQ